MPLPISIHAPRAGGDGKKHRMIVDTRAFQSTPPVRGATLCHECHNKRHPEFQSTPPVRGATFTPLSSYSFFSFQSTPPVRGATRGAKAYPAMHPIFQSTPPVRGAT